MHSKNKLVVAVVLSQVTCPIIMLQYLLKNFLPVCRIGWGRRIDDYDDDEGKREEDKEHYLLVVNPTSFPMEIL